MLCILVCTTRIDPQVINISGVEAVEREDGLWPKSWETLTFNQDKQRGLRRNREKGISVEKGFMLANQEKNCHPKRLSIVKH